MSVGHWELSLCWVTYGYGVDMFFIKTCWAPLDIEWTNFTKSSMAAPMTSQLSVEICMIFESYCSPIHTGYSFINFNHKQP